ncbi:hypothetical protein GS942_17055 [Rhodococcus hoagii]|nr:hypothetical protein [Prescottella equi]NKW33769.1 hypothetical protein [Prescottella equi]
MTLQPMLILDQLDHVGSQWDFDGRVIQFPEEFRQGIRRAKRVWLSCAGIDLDGIKASSRDEVGPQIPPFGNLWIETDAYDSRIATYITALAPSAARKVGEEYAYLAQSFVDQSTIGRPPKFLDNSLSVYADQQGAVRKLIVRSLSGEAVGVDYGNCGALDAALPAMAAIGLMNCRNVDIEQVERPSRKLKKQRRSRPPKLDYHTITLPGSRSGTGETSGGGQDARPQHKVRGHFKTYSEDAPLLGKHVGTYWWGWQVRGNKKNGITVTDYKLGSIA